MTTKQNEELEHIRLFVANLFNDEQDAHSKLVTFLRETAGTTNEFPKMLNILTRIYEAKIEILDKIYKEIQGI